MQNGKKTRPVGRPPLPKGQTLEGILPVRIDADHRSLFEAAAKANKQGLSEWIRDTLITAAENRLYRRTLHEAMKIVLADIPSKTATTIQLSEEIGQRGLFARPVDGKFPKASQINARARRYPSMFDFAEPGVVRLAVSNPSKRDSK